MRLVTFVCLVGLAGSACTGGSTPKPGPSATGPRRGGDIVIGAEQWPECVNPITSCASATWTHYTILQHVLPKAMTLDAKGYSVASPLLVEAPTLQNGGLQAGPPFTVTYRIRPEAVWDDGSPITSADFEFTWKAFIRTTGAYEAEDYEQIESVGSSDPNTAIVRFKRVLADWSDVFGGAFSFVLERSAFVHEGKVKHDLHDDMRDSIPFSGGPFLLTNWSKNQAVLVRNERYFGRPALLDRVTLIPMFDQEEEIASLERGDFAAIFPQLSFGSSWSTAKLQAIPNLRAVGGDGVYLEVLWFNHGKKPLDDPHVREALMYALDRRAVVERVALPFNPHAEVSGCGLVAFRGIGPWCITRPLDNFVYDPATSRAILQRDGYDCSATPCTKGGRPLSILYAYNENNVRRQTTADILEEGALAAGIDLDVKSFNGGLVTLSPREAPVVDYAVGGYPDPSVTSYFACDEIPSKSSPWEGGNLIGWCNQEADRLMHESDIELDPERRLALFDRIYEIEAEDFVSLPLYTLPVVSAWRTDKVAGPIGLYRSTPLGMFANLADWYVPAAAASLQT